jgi:endoglucanase Acf2
MTFFNIWIVFAYTAFVTATPAHVRRQGTSLQTTTTSTTYTQNIPTTQSATQTNVPDATGTLVTTLPSGSATSTPLPSGKTSTTGTVKVDAATSLTPAAVTTAAASSVDVFSPIATATPATSLFARRGDNTAPVKGITNTVKPLNTNKFYANFFLENQYNGAVSRLVGKGLIRIT